MPYVSEIERTATDGAMPSATARLLGALVIVWLPTLLIYFTWQLLVRPISGDNPGQAVFVGNNEPMGGIKAVLVIPTAAVVEFGALWWGGAVWLQERQKRSGHHHRRRRRRFWEKVLQRFGFITIPISLVANVPLFVWCLIHFYQSCLKF